MSDLLRDRRLLLGVAAAAASVYAVARQLRSNNAGLPPGPWGLPLLGRLPWLDPSHLEEGTEAMRRAYGEVYSYWAGQRLMIVVSSPDALRDLLRCEAFSGRLAPPFRQRLTGGCGLAFAEGVEWSDRRRLSLRLLSELGRSQALASVLDSEVERLCLSLAAQPQARDTASLFRALTNSVVATVVFGKRYSADDERYAAFVNDIEDIANLGVSSALGFLFPSLSRLLERLPAVSRYKRGFRSLRRFVEAEIAEREAAMEADACEEDACCLCDAFIRARHRAEASGGDSATYSTANLTVTAMEMFVAGTETTARSLQWLLLYMALNPEAQSAVQSELDRVVGSGRRPNASDKRSLHATQAAIDESLRLGSVDFNGLPHRALVEATFRGFRIPADAAVVPFTFGVHRDSSVWQRPHEFWLGHHLDPDGRYAPSKNLVPFLIGRRACPGEGLARLEIFLAFSAVMQRFRVRLPPGDQARANQLLRGTTGTVRVPGPHSMDFLPR